jgi:hypothetical protein
MTEQEWLNGTDAEEMLDFAFEKASRRKIELYTSGCYRAVWHLLTDERFRAKMDMRDRYFDGLATEADLDAALKAADEVPNRLWLDAWDSVLPQCRVRILHDLFGNPFRPVAVDPGWLTPDVVELARTVYDDRAFDRMPDLADALERAGCQNNDILQHCRQPGEHVRGCWMVDRILGKE